MMDDNFKDVSNQYKGPKVNLFSDSGYIKYLQSYIFELYSAKAHEIDLVADSNGQLEVILETGKIIHIDERQSLKSYRKDNML